MQFNITKIGDNDFRKNLPRSTPEAMEKNQALVDLLKRIADEKQATPAQIAQRLDEQQSGSCACRRREWISLPERAAQQCAASDADGVADDSGRAETRAAAEQRTGER